MTDNIQTIAKQALQALAISQKQVAELTQQLSKRASAALPDKSLVEQTVAALTKVGALTQQEGKQASQLFSSDPNAALRCITGLLSSGALSKTACQATDSLQFGVLVSGQRNTTQAPKQGRARVLEILRQST